MSEGPNSECDVCDQLILMAPITNDQIDCLLTFSTATIEPSPARRVQRRRRTTITTRNLKVFPRAIMSHSTFKFESSLAPQSFGPRLGSLKFRRVPSNETTNVPSYPAEREILTPGLLTTTSRGVIPHLSRDHAGGSNAVRWVNIPFETL